MTAALVVSLLTPLVQLPTTEAQSRDPEIAAALKRMNLYRSWLGLEPMQIQPQLQAAAEAHANYYRLNVGDSGLAGMGLHRETPGLPGFTGETMQDRVEAQGYSGWANENIGLSGSMLVSLEWFMGTINHRLPILDPRYVDVGMATIDQGDVKFEVIVFGMPEWQEFSTPEWTVWPPDGTTGTQLSFSGEAPNPFPGADFPTGLPITVSYNGPGQLSLDSWTISSDGQELASFGNVGDGFLTSHTALVAAGSPLEYGTTYDVTVTASVDGQPTTQSWSFTTRASDDEELARDGVSAADVDDDPEPPTVAAAPANPPPGAPVAGHDPTSPYPSGLQAAAPAVQQMWMQVDGGIASQDVARPWIYGPDVWAVGPEAYAEAGNGDRQVYYFDKARLEMTEGASDTAVTAGLLVRDMIAGQVQIGKDSFREIAPANIPLAGDPLKDNPNAPTYASLTGVASLDDDNRADVRNGEPIVAVIDQAGDVSTNWELEGLAYYGTYNETLGHNIPVVFTQFFETLPLDWQTLIGVPLTEPYWMQTRVGGELEWVLVQAFERRVVTYTPSNDPMWQVEMGNIGQHYYTWRYGIKPPYARDES